MSGGTVARQIVRRQGPWNAAQRRSEAHRLCAELADRMAQALRDGNEGAAKQYRDDLERLERVAGGALDEGDRTG